MASYNITNATQLQAMSSDLAGDYTLLNDIDMTGFSWTPVGTDTTPFTGTFDGNNFTISNLTYSATVSTSAIDGYGLWGTTDGADIHDLILDQTVISLTLNSGGDIFWVGTLIGFCGGVGGGTALSNCHSKNLEINIINGTAVSGDTVAFIGGLCGEIISDTVVTLEDCSAQGELNFDTFLDTVGYIGGFCGFYNAEDMEIEDCSATCDLNFDDNDEVLAVGGFIGFAYTGNSHITNCYAEGLIDFGTLGGEASSISCFIGSYLNLTAGDITGCYTECSQINFGENSDVAYVGGLFGDFFTQNANITNCHSNSTFYFDGNVEMSGGFIGNFTDGVDLYVGIELSNIPNTKFINCYHVGDLNFNNADASSIGGFLGEGAIEGGLFSGCYHEGDINCTNSDVTGTGLFTGLALIVGLISDCYCQGDINIDLGINNDLNTVSGFLTHTILIGNVDSCYYQGNININSSGGSGNNILSVSGFCSFIVPLGEINKCYADCEINIVCDDDCTPQYFGLFSTQNNCFGNISNCYAKGEINIESISDVDSVGGFCDDLTIEGYIQNCYSAVDINIQSEGDIGSIAGVGGFAGELTITNGSISNSYSAGIINAGTSIGGFIGVLNDNTDFSSLENCAWYIESAPNAIGNSDIGALHRMSDASVGTDVTDVTTLYETDHPVYDQ